MDLRLREYRLLKGFRQKDVAEVLGVTPQRYNNWERGVSDISLDFLVQCADLLECSLDALFGRPVRADYSDPQEAALHAVWQGLSAERRGLLVGVAENFECAESYEQLSVEETTTVGVVNVSGDVNGVVVAGENNSVDAQVGTSNTDSSTTVNYITTNYNE